MNEIKEFLNVDPIIKIYCQKRKQIWFKNINNCKNLVKNPNINIIYTKNNQEYIKHGFDYIGPDIYSEPCLNIVKIKEIKLPQNNTKFYFFIRGHIRNSFKSNQLKNFVNLLKLRFPNIIFILQTWKNQECKKNESWKKNIEEVNNIISESIINNYFENTDMSKNCLILDEETIKLEGSTDGNICSGPCPKKGWKNMWYGMYKGLEKINIDDQILVSFRYDYFNIPQTKQNETQILNFIEKNLSTKNIKFIQGINSKGVDNLYIGRSNNIKKLIEKFHFNLDEIINENKKIFHQEYLVNILANKLKL